MGYPVEVYVYDLSQGMASQLGSQLIGRPIEGIWHTAVVVHGQVPAWCCCCWCWC